MDTALRPMSTSQVLDRTFHLYRNNFVLFAGVAVVGPALGLVAQFIQLGAFGIPEVPIMPQPGAADPALLQNMLQKLVVQALAGLVLTLIFYTIGQSLATGATIYAVSMVHLGKPTTIRESYRTIKPIFGRILGILLWIYWRAGWPIFLSYAMIIPVFFVLPGLTRNTGGAQIGLALALLAVFLLSFVGLIGGAIWWVYAFCRYSLAIPACTLEKLTARHAMNRSKFLSEGSVLRIIGVYLLTIVMASILTWVLQIPAYIFGGNIFSMKPGSHVSTVFLFLSTMGGFVGQTLAGPIATIAIALLYYDQRVRKEAFDLQLMMENMGQPVASNAAAAPPAIG